MRCSTRISLLYLYCLGVPVCRESSHFSQYLFHLRQNVLGINHTGMRFFTTHYKQYESQVVTGKTKGEESLSISFSCPECGKNFLSERNLRQHRRSRHLLSLKSVAQERLEEIRETNSRLQLQLRELRGVNTLKDHSFITSSASPPHSNEISQGTGSAIKGLAAAVPDGKTVDISVAQLGRLRDHQFRLGTTISELRCVGVVEDDVAMGYLNSANGQGVDAEGLGLEILQFTLRIEGYRQRRVGQLKMYRNCLLVRVVNPQWKIQRGDVLLVSGTYGLHKSYDMVSKQAVENAVLEAGYVGLLQRGPK
ncbi:hypothetical protein LSM04_009205 [Trypanosoma melophagium]|uniref:uncharacterized protein n=1 Tax=Trypanosoma melophagium TaxID=715481 RepID=UPI00351A953A|nr:hypothetical protein LSM04_009205 [Trypanosoma melophagium]